MPEFKSNSLWMKSSFLLLHISLGSILTLFTARGWGTVGPGLQRCDGNTCGTSWYTITEACMVMGYLSLLCGIVLCQCVVLLDEVAKMKKGLSIAWTVFTLLAGLFIFVGDAAYIAELPNSFAISNAWTMVTAFVLFVAGVFVALDLAKVKPPKFLSK
ncbi:hypothetical protein CAPTEDRAFT_222662 [Capitella teleta]|uniref:MARVEL domain-containing protein n=1 Tax=Capitella teleta TaxID=283909 RepID=R7TV81_CAPTE|nr:hypothetical protein CAPTEDRAFT_222662 [Capitella teleta]|eukprot:ELT95361.1 hypothetical protein CAPTEDRAFT_222662 [Capitella teleta]